MTAAFLRQQGHEVDALDAGALNCDWKRFGDQVYQSQYDVISIVNDFDNIDTFSRTLRYIRVLSPDTKVVTSGRLSSEAPLLFRSTDIDGIVISGDPEAGITSFVDWVAAGLPTDRLPAGVTVQTDGRWRTGDRGRYLKPEDWVLPNVAEIPYAAYGEMYKRDESKFCGIPCRRELVVPVARGCPIGCFFCDVPGVQGVKDRRLTVQRTLEYIETCFRNHPFEYVAFYAPTFTLNRKWTRELCRALIDAGSPFPWKCASTIAHLPRDLVELMAKAGCIRISVGLETLEEDVQTLLPSQKRIEYERFRKLAYLCASHNIEINCFVISGLPGTTPTGLARTVAVIREAGGRVRPTAYGDVARIRKARTIEEAVLFNRQLLHPTHDRATDLAMYDIVFGVEPAPTQVMDRIPMRDLDVGATEC